MDTLLSLCVLLLISNTFGIATMLNAIDGIAYKTYGKSGITLYYQAKKEKRNAKKRKIQ